MTNTNKISRRSVVKAIGTIPLVAAARPLRAAERNSQVIVIGAGLSGLNAALLLEEQGLKVQVIEGRERVGGRVLSHRNVPGNPESGGTSFGPGYARIVDTCNRLGVPRIDVTPVVPFFNQRELVLDGRIVPAAEWPGHPRNPFPAEQKATPPWFYLNPIIGRSNPLKTADAWVDPANFHHDVSLHEWLVSLGVSEDIIDLCWNNNPAYGNTAHDVSAMMAMFSSAFTQTQIQLGGRTFGYTAVGGNMAIPEAMAKALRREVHFGREVVGIRSGKDGGSVHCADGTVYEADFILCSLPCSVLRRLHIDPLVTGAQALGINTLESQAVNMIHLGVKKPYWTQDGLSPNQFGDNLAGMVVAERKGQRVEDVSSVTIWIRGLNALWMDTMDEKEAIARVMADFYRVRPAARGAVEVRAYKSWGRDPFSAGDWAVWQPGQVKAFANDIARPHGRLHFCGEHTSIANRGMEGAMESGERAAFEILQLI